MHHSGSLQPTRVRVGAWARKKPPPRKLLRINGLLVHALTGYVYDLAERDEEFKEGQAKRAKP
jgi:hypothetical protein